MGKPTVESSRSIDVVNLSKILRAPETLPNEVSAKYGGLEGPTPGEPS